MTKDELIEAHDAYVKALDLIYQHCDGEAVEIAHQVLLEYQPLNGHAPLQSTNGIKGRTKVNES